MFQALLTKLLTAAARSIIKFKYLYFIMTIGLAVLSFLFAKKIEIDPNFNSLVDADHPVVQTLDEITKVYGGIGSHILIVKGKKKKQTEAFIDDLVRKLNNLKEIRFVNYKATQLFFEKYGLLYIDFADLTKIYNRLYRKISYEKSRAKVCLTLGCDFFEEKDPGLQFTDIVKSYKKEFGVKDAKPKSMYFYKPIENNKRHMFVVLAKPSQSSTEAGKSVIFIEKVDQVLTELKAEYNQSVAKGGQPNIEVQITGRYQKRIDSLKGMQQDMNIVTWVAGIGILVILTVYFRSFLPIVLVFSALIIGMLYTFAATQVVFAKLNLVTSILLAVLLGLGIDFGIHFLVRYKEEREEGRSVEDAFTQMLVNVGSAAITSGLTTSFAFFILNLSDFRAFSELGNIAGMGIIFVLISMIFFLGSALMIVEGFFTMRFHKNKLPMCLPESFYQRPKILIYLGAVTCLIAALGFYLIKFDYNFGKMTYYPDFESYYVEEELEGMFDASLTPSVILPDNEEHEKEIIRVLNENIKANEDNPNNRFHRVLGLSSFIPTDQGRKIKMIYQIRNLLDNNKKYRTLFKKKISKDYYAFEKALYPSMVTLDKLPDSIRNNFLGLKQYKDRHIVLLYPRANFDSAKHVLEFSEQISKVRVNGRPLKIASADLIAAEILNLITGDGYLILLWCFLGVFVLVALNFKSFKRGLFVLIPLAVGVYWLAGFMGVLGVQIDYYNVIIFPIIIGIGIDSGVHIYMRYREDGDMIRAVRFTGKAVALSSLTTMVGFGALSLGQNQGFAGIGKVAIIGLITTYLASTVILPAIVLLKDSFKKKEK